MFKTLAVAWDHLFFQAKVDQTDTVSPSTLTARWFTLAILSAVYLQDQSEV